MLLAPKAMYVNRSDGYLIEVEFQSEKLIFHKKKSLPVRAFLLVPSDSSIYGHRFETGIFKLEGKLSGFHWHPNYGFIGDFGAFVPVVKIENTSDISR